MGPREFTGHSIEELEDLTEVEWNNLGVLIKIHEELLCRSSKKSLLLERRVVNRLWQLNGGDIGKSSSSATKDPSVDGMKKKIKELESMVETYREESLMFKKELAKEELYAPVGLSSSCEDFVLQAVRKAYQKEYHPDKHTKKSPDEQKKYEEKFKVVDNQFDTLEKKRKNK